MLKLKQLRHPLRTASVASALVRTHLHIRSSAERSRQYYRGDSRYALDNVDRGFISRSRESGIGDREDDTALLQ